MNPHHLVHLVTVPQSALLLLDVELRYFTDLGWRVGVITGEGPHLESLQEGHPAVDVHVVPSLTRRMDPRADVVALRDLTRVLRRIQPDVLHTHMPKTGWIGRVAGRVAGVPRVVNTCHGLYARQLRRRSTRSLALGLEWVSEAFAHENLFQNHDDLRTMHTLAPWRQHRHIGNGIDPERFAVLPDKGAARERLGLPANALVVGAVGRLIAHKGVREFAYAAQQLDGQATFAWVGPMEPEKSTAMAAPGPPVRYLGEQTDMPAVYAALDIFVLPSYMEGVPRSAMEAAASGVPLVLTDIPGSRDLGHDGVDLRLVPPGDAQQLTEAIHRLLQDPRERMRLGEAARARVRAHHDQQAIAERLRADHYAIRRRPTGALT